MKRHRETLNRYKREQTTILIIKYQNFEKLLGLPCEVVEQPPADHFHQKFETIHQMFRLN